MTDITVVKCGGNVAENPREVCRDVARMHSAGRRVVLVHGGSAEIDRLADRLGVRRRRLRTPGGAVARYTDEASLEVVHMALTGVAKPRFLGELARLRVPAVGLTGLDGRLAVARRKEATRAIVDDRTVVVRDNHAGVISRLDTGLLRSLLASGVVPVLSPPAVTEDGRPVNVDADRMAAAVAAALSATELILLTGAPGVLRDPDDEESLLPVYRVGDRSVRAELTGGMAVKMFAAERALRDGVPRVVVADGRRPRPVRTAQRGAGTVLTLAPGTSGVSR